MRRLDAAIAVALACIWLGGCATSALDMAPERPDQPWRPAVTADGEIIPGKESRAAAGTGYVLPSNPRAAAIPEATSIDRSKIYTLPELIDLAESTNLSTRIAWNDARKAALAAGIVESSYLPKITATAVGAYQANDGRETVQGMSADSDNSERGAISAISLQWLLFDFGERAAVLQAARQGSVISNIAFTAAHQLVIHDVSLAFYAHAAATERLTTAQRSLVNARAVQAAAEQRFAHGVGTIIEAAQARQATAQTSLAVVQASGGAQDSYLSLLAAVGIPPLTKIKIADISGRKLSPALARSVDDLIASSLSRRPDVLSAFAAQKAALANVRAAKAEFLPKVFVGATGSYNSSRLDLDALPGVAGQSHTLNVSGSHLGATIVAGVAVPLYDGGSRAATLAQARAEADSAEARLTRVRDEAIRQIALADNMLRSTLAAWDATQALVSAAQTTFDAALAAYRSGVGSITDLTLAQSQLLQAKMAAADAYSTALSAAASLALETGALGSAPD